MVKRLENIECEEFSKYLMENNIPFLRIETNIPARKDGFGKIKQLKKEGWKSGYADYFITMPVLNSRGNIEYCGLFIEMKKNDGAFPLSNGKDEQYDFLLEKAYLKYATFCCKGHVAAIQTVENYLQGKLEHIFSQTKHVQRKNDKRLKCISRCYNIVLEELHG